MRSKKFLGIKFIYQKVLFFVVITLAALVCDVYFNQNIFAKNPPQTGKHDGGGGGPVEGCSSEICYTIHQK